ncbi:MAG: 23S rRNA (guanosine(2251)-2'-O)-methyltransferase RlmB [Epsilonproteobacteria bacterium]|nr:23S rRNA (guanosine(2251)-2'-O)-methyltransferase RlmB [Campylobacterota bacterium]NPA56782.1 23S rRNA (guanosine(2251)-2'-O)-methyltransferase RlmB [Campylobacterota bacterium]
MYIYGKQIFNYLLERHRDRIERVLLAKEIDPKLFKRLKALGIPIERIDNRKAQALARGGNHQGFIVEIDPPPLAEIDELKEGEFLVILHQVTDTGNIGSIVRSGYALGADGIVVTGLSSLNMEGIIRTSSGAALDMPISLVSNLYDLIKELRDRGFRLYAATTKGRDVREFRFQGKRALLLGSEGEGLPQRAIRGCDHEIGIVMRREFDSLNVSAAAAIFIDRMRDE